SRDPAMLIVSVSSFAVAALSAVVATIAGLMELDSAHAWQTAPTDTREHVDAALSLLDRAQTEAILCDVMFAVAGAAAAAGVVFLVVEVTSGSPRSSETPPEPHPTVALVPAGTGLALRGTW